jgi:glutaredoxin 3
VPDVLMYTKPYCWYCKAAKRLLEERGVAYVEVDLLRYPERTGEMRAKAPAHTVPQIFIDDLAIGRLRRHVCLGSSGQARSLARDRRPSQAARRKTGLRACAKISRRIGAPRRPAGKTRGGRILVVRNRRACQRGEATSHSAARRGGTPKTWEALMLPCDVAAQGSRYRNLRWIRRFCGCTRNPDEKKTPATR